MMKFALLASGSKGNCCLIRDAESSIVIDCGATKKYLKECFDTLRYDHTNSDALFVSHTHKDHVSQLNMFTGVKTYARCALDTDCFERLTPLSTTHVNTLCIKEIPLSHDSDICSGFVVESAHRKLVYITDTGYIKEEYLPHLKGADYYIFESNHDIDLLMKTNRPMFVKQRIVGDLGHMCNEDSAYILSQLINENTKEVVLAHISEEGNTHQQALHVLRQSLLDKDIDDTKIRMVAAPQFKIVVGGDKL